MCWFHRVCMLPASVRRFEPRGLTRTNAQKRRSPEGERLFEMNRDANDAGATATRYEPIAPAA